MRELMKRLERLEDQTATMKDHPPRIIRQIVAPGENGPVYNPARATCGRQAIERDDAETVRAFEVRALAHFAASNERIVIHA